MGRHDGSVDAPHFNLSLDTLAYRVMGGFRIAPALYIDGGVRRFAVKMTASILDFQPVTWKPGIWEPVVGATFRPRISRNLRLFTQADVGFTGDDSSRSGAATAIVEWSPLSHLSVGGGWGWTYLKADGIAHAGRVVAVPCEDAHGCVEDEAALLFAPGLTVAAGALARD